MTTNSTDLVPATNSTPSGLSRRSMLAGLGLGSVGLLATPALLGCDRAQAATPPAQVPAAKPAANKRRRPKPRRRLLDADGNYVQPGPYTAEASCDLSEDYFLTDEVLIGADDEILPFRNTANGMTEAIVLSGGQLNHLRHDPSATSGWSYKAISAPFGNITSAAVTSSSTQNAVIMALGESVAAGMARAACQLSLGADGTWSTSANGAVLHVGSVGAGSTGTGDIYFYGWQHTSNTKAKTDDFTFYRWNGTGANAGLTGTTVFTLSYPTSGSVQVVAADLHLAAKIGGFPYDFAVVTTSTASSSTDGNVIDAYRIIDGTATLEGIPTDEQGVGNASLLWSYVSPDASIPAPAMVWQTNDGNIHFVDETGAQANLFTGTGSVGAGQVAAWQLDGEYTFAVRGTDSTVSVVSQFGTGGDSGFTLPIPLITGIDRIYGVPTDASEGTLFAVDLDDTLSVLTNTATTGWTQNVTHQDGAINQELTCWNTKIKITDTNLTAVTGASVQLSTDLPIALWQANGGATVLVPGTPVIMSCDVTGTLAVSIPASELDTAVLTAQPLDSDNKPYGTPLTITPNIDVHNFLAGSGSLMSIGSKLTGTALTSAQKKTWDTTTRTYVVSGPLLPALSNSGADAATQVAAAMNHVMSLPTNTPSGSAPQAALLDFTGSSPSFSTSTDPTAYDSHKSGDTSWWDRAKHDAESAFHGLRHAAMRIKKMVTTFAADVNNIKQWTINLIIDIGDGLDHLMNWVVTGVKDAIHAISGFFHSLGADIEHAWNWLKNFVLGVIKDADATAKQLQAWFGDLATAGVNILDNLEKRADTFFEDLETTVTDEITTWKGDVEGTLFGSVAPTPTRSTDSSGDDSGALFKVVDDFYKVMQHSPAHWLWHKVMSHVHSIDADDLHIDMSVFQDSLLDLNAILTKAKTTATDLGTTMSDAFKTFSTTQGFNQTDIGDLFDDFNKLAHDVLVMLDLVVDTVLDLIKDFLNALVELLTSEFELPIIGDLLELAGVDATTSIGRVMTLIAAYPITVVHNLWAGNGPLWNFDDVSESATGHGLVGRGAADKNGFGLDLAAGVVQFIWAGVDEIIDVLSIPGKGELETGEDFLNVTDFVLPAIMTILQWPTPWNAKTTPIPCKNWDFSDASVWGKRNNFIVGIIITTIAPWWCQGATFIWNTVDDTSIDAEFFDSYVTPFIQCLAAGANNVLGAWWQYDNSDASKTDKANAVLDWTIPNLSYVDCPLGIQQFIDMSEGATAVAKIVIDTVANYGATAFCFQQAVAAKNG